MSDFVETMRIKKNYFFLPLNYFGAKFIRHRTKKNLKIVLKWSEIMVITSLTNKGTLEWVRRKNLLINYELINSQHSDKTKQFQIISTWFESSPTWFETWLVLKNNIHNICRVLKTSDCCMVLSY